MRDAEGPGAGRPGQKAWRSGAGPAPGGTECGLTIQGSQVLSLKKPQSGFHLWQLGCLERSPFHTTVQGILDKKPRLTSGILAWRAPWTEEPGGLWSTGSQSQTRLSD